MRIDVVRCHSGVNNMKVCLIKRNENQFKASVKAIAASNANNSSVGCHELFLRERELENEIEIGWRVSGAVVREKAMW
jgi:hypothetical protein